MVSSWSVVLTESLQNVWLGVANFIPTLLVAIIIVIVGWIVGSLLFKLVEKIVGFAKVDGALRAAGFEGVMEKAGFKLNSGYFLGKLVEWFFIVVFLVTALDVLGLKEVTTFLSGVVLTFLPNVIVAVLMILIAAVVAESMEKIVVGSAKAAGMKSVNFAGRVTRWAIWIFAILAAVMQVGIAVPFIQTLFTGIVIAVALALGLAFGLGGQDAAARFIEKLKGDLSDHQ